MKKIIFIVILIIILGIAVTTNWQYINYKNKKLSAVSNFESCVAARRTFVLLHPSLRSGKGSAVLESYPRQCQTPDGKTFVEDIGNELEKTNLIRVQTPRPNELVQSPLEIKGEARGFWFFEASFPVKLLDANGKELEVNPSYAQTKGEWMTEDFVPFEAIIEFETPTTKKGTLILEKDNPSGLPENADELRIPVTFYK